MNKNLQIKADIKIKNIKVPPAAWDVKSGMLLAEFWEVEIN